MDTPLPAPSPDVATPTAPSAAPAAPATPTNSRCPTGTTVALSWQGEYPGPVVDVKTAVTLPARMQPCDAGADAPCAVPAGLYHPWASAPAKFGTIRAVDHYRLLRPAVLEGLGDGKTFDAGTLVDVEFYAGEGFCDMIVAGKAGELASCPEQMSDDKGPLFEKLPGLTFTEIQVLGVTCADGTERWIDVNDELFTRPEVKQGGITEYGKADPAP